MTIPLVEIVTTKDIVEAVRAFNIKESRPDTDYQVAKILQISESTISGYYTRNGVMDENIAIRACKLIDWPVDIVLICLRLESAKKANSANAAEVWEGVVKTKLSVLAVFLCVFCAFPYSQINFF